MTAYRNTLATVCLHLFCVTVIGIAAGAAHAATVQYTMFIDSAGPGTWEVRADASQGDNWGLELVSVPLVNVDFPVTLELPWIQYFQSGVKDVGINFFPSVVSPIGAAQDLSDVSLLVYGLGQSDGILSSPGGSMFLDSQTGSDNVAYDAALLIATGTYQGAAPEFGSLSNSSANVFLDQSGENIKDAVVSFAIVQVPEPGTWVLAAVGLLSIWIAGHRNTLRDRQTVC